MDKNKTHYVSVTCIIKKEGKYLICKRRLQEKAFPGKWCVPGGKIEQSDFLDWKKDTSDHWLGIVENVVMKEVKEETNLEIKNIDYVSSLVFIRPNGYSTIILSMCADYDSGEIVLNNEELVESAWVSVEEAKKFDLIENIYEQILKVDSEKTI